jgi:hypothetical protein
MTNYNAVQQFKENFNGGTRANRFEVISTSGWPDGVQVDNVETKFKIISTTLPQATLGTINVGYRGRNLNLAGDRAYKTWNIQVYDDCNSNSIWQAFQKWKELLDSHTTHTVAGQDFAYKTLKKTWIINQLDINGTAPIRSITLHDCYPISVGALNMDMKEVNLATFNVSLQFDYYEITQGL